MNLPSRGGVWQCDFGMAAKVRPALVLNVPFADHGHAPFHVVPHTTAIRALSFLQQGVFDVQGSQSISRNWLVSRLGALSPEESAEIEESFRRWLQF
ncbi:MAG TPA: type II toxin-antitoxin system PemK/MazF family toxin [Verrucomicrobiae bacterium]|nr:type II toxin-antitoxin system PemK/MazF family toxin [Verrucomicrobiae bacterium]